MDGPESCGGFSEDGEYAGDAPTELAKSGPRYSDAARVGAGSMGVVEVVTDRELGREVARKRLREGGDLRAAERLRREAAVAASLEHPGIVPVYDVGEGRGGPWYTMRLVRGRTLAEVLRGRQTMAERLPLLRRFLVACEAVAYGHRRGVIHRDLKPANIMLGDEGETQVVDWGLARAAPGGGGGALASDARLTAAGAVLGTPAYMSPEQAGAFGEPYADARSDVWSLGAILFEILGGAPPYEGSSEEVLRQLGVRAPDVTRVAEAPRELVAIVSRALAHRPEDRYASAEALTEDLERHLEGRLVDAYDYGPLDHLRRFVRAFRLPLTVAAVASAGLLLGATYAYDSVVQEGERARAAEVTAQVALADARASNARLTAELATREAARGRRTEALALAREALSIAPSPAALGVLAAFGLETPPSLLERGPACSRARVSPNGALRLCIRDGEAELREGVRVRFRRSIAPTADAFLTDGHVLFIRLDTEHRVAWVDLEGETVSEGHLDVLGEPSIFRDQLLLPVRGGVYWRRADDPELLEACDGARPNAVALGVMGPAFACPDRTVRAAGRTWTLPAQVSALDWRGEDLVVGTRDGRLRTLEGRHESRLGPGAVLSVASDDGWVVAAAEADGLWVWHPERGLPQRLPVVEHRILRFSGGVLETSGPEGIARWRMPRGSVARLDAEGGVASMAAAAGRIVVGRGDGCARAWDGTGERLGASCEGDAAVKAVAFDGERVWLVRDGEAGLAVLDHELHPRGRLEGPGSLRRVARLESGALVAVTYGVGRLRFDGRGGVARLPPADANHVDIDARGADAVTLTSDGRVTLLRGDRAELHSVVPGARAVTLGSDGRVYVGTHHRVVSGEIESTPSSSAITTLRADPTGRWIAVGHRDGLVRVLDAGLRDVAVFPGHTERVSAIAWDGAVLVTGSWDGVVRRWDARVFESWERVGMGEGERTPTVAP